MSIYLSISLQICNAVAVAKIMNATLILPVLKQDQIWKDQTWVDLFNLHSGFYSILPQNSVLIICIM